MPQTIHALSLVILLIILQNGISNEQILPYWTNRQAKNCAQLSTPTLNKILGPAFNSRYMSFDKPPVMEEKSIHGEIDGKRDAIDGLYPSFYVDNDYLKELANSPAWAVDHARDTDNHVFKSPLKKRDAFVSLMKDLSFGNRSKRNSHRGYNKDGISRPWACDSRIHWIDLGPEYYPRFLRTVECAKTRCWYRHYQCVPRSFTVKLLRKRTGQCVPVGPMTKIGIEGLPGELRELWVWEERAVNFCCDCSPGS